MRTMNLQADRAWQLYKALGDIDDSFVAEAGGDNSSGGVPKKANVRGKVIRIFPKVFLVAALIAIPASAMGDSSLFDTVKAKTEGVGATNEEMQAVCKDMALMHVTPGVLSQLPPLRRNDDGLIYGFESSITDLVYSFTDDGKWGYSYRWDMYGTADASPELKFYKLTHVRKMHVYEKDGKTLIGYSTCGWMWPPETPHIGMR